MPEEFEHDLRRTEVRSARKGKRKRRVRAVVWIVVGCLVLAAALVTGAWWTLLFRVENPVAAGRKVVFTIRPGESTRVIALRLAREGIVDNSNMFRMKARSQGADGRIKTGEYELTTRMDYGTVLDRLQAGPPARYSMVTIPEGFVIDQIAERFEAAIGIPAGEFSQTAKTEAASFGNDFLESNETGSLEGYLFPKTYRVKEKSTARQVIQMMLDQFGKETAGLDLGYASVHGLDFHKVVTLASMVERETKVPKERYLAASVMYNRLERNMFLEIDATIQYVLPESREHLLYRHLRIDSPYNTYRYKGLPPGPISSPGLASLQAAAKPAETQYLYYVLTGKDGSHTFTATQEEFLKAKQRSKALLR